MTLFDFWTMIQDNPKESISIVSIFVTLLVEKSKHIKFQPFTQLGIFLGNWMKPGIMLDVENKNKVIIGRIEALESKVENINSGCRMHSQGCHEWIRQEMSVLRDTFIEELNNLKDEMTYQVDSSKMENYRHLMFRFEEGIIRGVSYTKDHWDSMNNMSKRYVEFCKDNDNFINSECEGAIKLIQDTWQTRPWKNNLE